MKTEWSEDPHRTVKWALIEALRASDNASTVDYWDVVTENLIRELELQQQWAEEGRENVDQFDSRESVQARLAELSSKRMPTSGAWVSRLISDWKREGSDA